MNLKDFAVKAEGSDHFEIKHPSGKSLKVEKASLSPKAHDLIRKMCSGGAMADGGKVQKLNEGDPVEGQNTVLASNENTPRWTPPIDTPVPTPMPSSAANVAQPPTPPATSVASAAPPPQMNQQPDAMAQGKSESLSLLEKQGQQGQDYLNTLKNVGDQQQKISQNYINQTAQMKTPDQIMADYKAKDDAFMQHMMESKVDPNRFWNDKSTGSKVVAGLGIILSGMGAGANGQNMAAQTLNNAINRDIQSQQADQSKNYNLWKMNRESMGSDMAANLQTRNQMLSMVQAKLAAGASTLSNAQAQQQAMNGINQIEQEKINTRRSLALLTPQGGGPGQPGMLQSNPLDVVGSMNLPPEQRNILAKEVGRAQSVAASKDHALQLFDQAAKDTRPMTGNSVTSYMNAIPGYTPQSLNSLDSAVEPAIKDADGKINEITKHTYDQNKPHFGDSDDRVLQKRQAIANMYDEQSAAPQFKAATGIDIKNFASTNMTNPVGRLSPQEQRIYQIAKAHPNDPASELALKKLGVK